MKKNLSVLYNEKLKSIKGSYSLQSPDTVVHPVCPNVGPFVLTRSIPSSLGVTWVVSEERQYGCRLNCCAVK